MSKKMNLIERFYQEVFGVLKRLRKCRKIGSLPHFRGVVCLLALALSALVPSFIEGVEAAFPQQINYQGKLTNASNIPVSNANYSIVFTIYDAASGGTNKWTETQTVTTESGFFNVVLGSTTSIGTDVFDGNDRWLGIKVGADSEMTPRQKLTSVGHAFYAYNADKLDGQEGSYYAPASGGNYVLKAGDTMTGNLTMSASSIHLANGSAAVPSLSFAGDTDNGFYYSSANNWRLVAGGNAILELDASGVYVGGAGNIGSGNNITMVLKSFQADGATKVGVATDTYYSFVTPGAKIHSFKTGGTEKAYIDKDGTIVSSGLVRGVSLESTVATGTAPLTVASTTKVTNLNADLLDGLNSTAFATSSDLGNYVLKAGDTMTGTLTSSATASFQSAAGSNNVPSYSFSGDPNTGFYSYSDGIIGVSSNGGTVGVLGSSSFQCDTMAAVNSTTLTLLGKDTDSASALGVKIRAYNALTTSGAKIASFVNATTEKAYIDKDGTIVSSGLVRGVSLESTVATGTAPLTVASTTKVTNLNADLLDGLNSTAFATSSDLGNYVLKAGDTMTGTLTSSAAASFRAAAGSMAVPSYSFSGDPDTGFYSEETGVIGFASGGAVIGTIGGDAFYFPPILLPYTNISARIRGRVANGATAIGLKFGNQTALTTAGAKIASFYSDVETTEKAYIDKDGTIVSSGLVRGVSLESTVATGTAPLTVASTTKVTNLNADLLDGLDSTAFSTTATDYGRSGVAADLYEDTTKLTDKYVKKAGDTMTGTLTNSATASFRAADGSVAVPSYSFTSDPDTGFYKAAVSDLRLAVDGALVAEWTSAGHYTNQVSPVGAVSMAIKGAVADGATAIGAKIGNTNTLSTSGAKIASFYSDNLSTEKAYINKDGTIVSSGLVRGASLESTVATGTAPLTVASSTVVTNLNADKLDGHEWSEVPTGSNYVLKAGDTMTGILTMSASSIRLANGTLSLPSLSFASAPTLGFYYSTSNYFWAVSGGSICAEFGPGYMAANTIFPTTTTVGLQFYGMASDGATAKANKFGNYWTLATAGAKIASFYNDNFTTEKAYIDKDGTIVSSGLIRGVSLESTVATGTAPLTVASTTKVTNLNADLLDGLNSTAFATSSDLGNYVLKAGDTMTGTLTSSATASFQAADGSAGVPSYSLKSDPDTGFYAAGSGQMRFASNGVAASEFFYSGFAVNTLQALGAVGLELKGVVADGASAIGVKIGNYNTLNTSGAKIVSFYPDNLSTEKAYITKDGTIVSSGLVRGVSLESTVATGTAPLTIASTTKVTNLNADLLDDLDSSAFATSSSLGNYVLKAGDTMTGTLTNSANASFQAAAGSSSVPSYSFSGAPTKGFYLYDANSIGISAYFYGSSIIASNNVQTPLLYGTGTGGVLGIMGQLADGASAIGVKIGNYNTLNTSGAKIVSFYPDNLSTEKAYITKDGTIVSSGLVKGASLESTVASGSAPLTVASTTKVTNLNADLLDGNDSSAFATTGSLGNYVLKAGDTMTGTLTMDAGVFRSNVADSGSNNAFTLISNNTISGGRKVLSVQNASSEKMYVSDSGNMGIAQVLAVQGGLMSYGQGMGATWDSGLANRSSTYTHCVLSSKASSATTRSVIIGSEVDLTHSGAKLLSLQNNTSEKAFIDKDGTIVSSGLVRGVSLESTVATGSAPLTVASSTVVTNLNADKLDGNDSSAFATSSDLGNYVLKAGDTMTGNLTMSASSVHLANGTAAAPSLAFTSLPQTGFYADTDGVSMALGIGGARYGRLGTDFRYNTIYSLGANTLTLKGQAADGASAVGATIGNLTALSTAGAKIISFVNATTEKAYIDKDGTIVSSGLVKGVSLESTIATGSAPLTVASTTLVTNLNADLLDGNHASAFAASGDLGNYVLKAGDTMTGTLTSSATASFQAANGTSAAPSYSFTNEPGMGFYRLTASQLSVMTAGGEFARFAGGQVLTNRVASLSDNYTFRVAGSAANSATAVAASIRNTNALTTAGAKILTFFSDEGVTEKAYIDKDGTIVSSGLVRGVSLESTVATGTAPLTVASTTKVTNLNADLLDGLDSTAFATSSDLGNYVLKAGDTMTGVLTTQASAHFATSSGRVGIGTAGPSEKLEVAGSVLLSNNNYLKIKNTTGTAIDVLGLDGSNIVNLTTAANFNLKDTGGQTFITADYNTNNLYLQPTAGNVGIGTTNPTTAKLQISSSTGGILGIYNLVTPTIAADTTQYDIGDYSGARQVVQTGKTNSGYAMGMEAEGYLAGAGNLAVTYGIRADSGTMSGGTGTVTNAYGAYIRILNGGGGTISNGYGLVIADVEASNDYGVYQAGSDDYNYFAGSVGIGTATPGAKLEVSGNVKATTLESTIATGSAPLTVASTTKVTNLNADLLDGHEWSEVPSMANYVLKAGDTMTGVLTTQASAHFATSSGNVGIGTTTPSAALEVLPSGTSSSFRVRPSGYATQALIDAGASGQYLRIDTNIVPHSGGNKQVGESGTQWAKMYANIYYDGSYFLDPANTGTSMIVAGNVGIGTVSPDSALQVNGLVKAISFESTVATGTAPLTIASTTVVTNLNADLLDGSHASAFATTGSLGNYVLKAGDTMTGTLTNSATASFQAAAGSVAVPSYSFSGDPDTGIFRQDADAIGISVGGIERARFTSTIFYSNPLIVPYGANTLSLLAQIADGATAIGAKIGNTNTLSTSGAKIASFYSDQFTTEKAYIDRNGTIVSSGLVRGASLESTIATGTAPLTVASTTLVTNLNADLLDGSHASAFATTGSLGNYVLKAGDTMTGTLTIDAGKGLTVDTNTLFVDAANDRVGIGTAAPGTKLDVAGTTNIRGTLQIRSSGNVGNLNITDNGGGTATIDNASNSYLNLLSSASINFTTAKLEVYGGYLTLNNGAYLDINRNVNVQSGISYYDTPGGYSTWVEYMSPAGQTGAGPSGTLTAPSGTFVTSWAHRNLIENTANFGWTFESGTTTTTTPAVKFEIRSSDGLFHAYGGGIIDGNVGIGTTSPSEKLNVAGTILATGLVKGASLESTVATGSAPLTVASTTKVTNLNADLLDGLDSTAFATTGSLGNYVLKAGDTMTGTLTNSATASFQAAAGSAAVPSYSFSGNPNTGLFNNTANQVSIALGGTTYALFSSSGVWSSGFVGLGGLSAAIQGTKADGGSTIGVKVGNYYSLTTAGAKIASFYSDSFTTEKAYIDKDGTIVSGGLIRGVSLESTVATGTAPLTVASTTKVTNLNADLLDGHDWSEVPSMANYVLKAGDTMTGTLTNSASVHVSGSVGIGTTTPGYKLQVGGTIAPTGHLTSGQNLGDPSNYWHNIYGDYLNIYNNGTNPVAATGGTFAVGTSNLYVSTTGNVGVGTTDPPSKLSVGGSNISIAIGDLDGTGASPSGIQFMDSGVKHVGFRYDGSKLIYEDASAAVLPSTWYNNATADFIVRNGNVGIGTLTPEATLHTTGNVKATNYESTVATGTSPLTVASTTVVTNLNADLLDGLDSTAFSTTSSDYGRSGVAADLYESTTKLTDKYVKKAGDTMTGTLTSSATTAINASGNAYLATTSGNKVGIGTTAPTRQLTISGANQADLALVSTDQGALITDGFNLQQAGVNTVLLNREAGSMSFWTNSTQQMTILSGGNVGIGTTSPQRKLDVSNSGQITFGDDVVTDSTNGVYWHAGSSYGIYRTSGGWSAPNYQQLQLYWATGIILNPGTGYGKSYVDVQGDGLRVSSGNVGIGTTSPSEKLNVAGTILATGLVKAASLESTIATGSAPLTVASTTKVTNLNADLLDGNDSSAFVLTSANNTFTGTNTFEGAVHLATVSGNVGIGTTAPSAGLHVVNTGTQSRFEYNSSNWHTLSTDSSGFLNISRNNSTGAAVIIGGGNSELYIRGTANGLISHSGSVFSIDELSGNPINIGNSSSSLRLLPAGGYVGIGTTSPSEKLNVAGTILATGLIKAASLESTVATGSAPLTIASTTVVTNLNADLLDGLHGNSYAPATGGNYVLKAGDTMTGTLTSSATTAINASGNAYLATTSGNKVGIGTTNPGAKLEVAGQYFSTKYGLTYAATIALDWNNANVQSLTLTGNTTFTFTNGKAGGRYIIILTQPAGGGKTVAWPAEAKWSGGTAPTLTATAAKTDIISFVCDGTYFYGGASLNY